MPTTTTHKSRGSRLAAGALLLAVLLQEAALAAEPRNSFLYRPPDRPPRGERNHYVEAPPEWLLDQVAAHLRELGLKVEETNKTERRVVARYSGDPREFVDCGVVEMLIDGQRSVPPKQYSANRPETRTYRASDGRRIGFLREMRLDARVAVEVEAQGKGSRVTTNAIYVLTKTISRVYKGGEPGAVIDREVMSFESTEIGRFKKGTSCVATGRLEDLPVAPFRKSGT
jgi:hypothetical protein